MNVASLELCKELYELSGWEDSSLYDHHFVSESSSGLTQPDICPAYPLGYLLRKLQATSNVEWSNGWLGYRIEMFWDEIDKNWSVLFKNTDTKDDEWDEEKGAYGLNKYTELGNTPEDATAKLCIELIKQGILK